MRNNQGLTINQVANIAPSVFATKPASTTSDKYNFIPTSNVLETLNDNGWRVTSARQSNVRLEARQGFQKHALTLTHADYNRFSGLLKVDDIIPEITLTNSHDGAGAFHFFVSLFRCICNNQMSVPDTTIADFRLRHSGTNKADILTIAANLIEETPQLVKSISEMQATKLDKDTRIDFAEQALKIRWPESAPINATSLLYARRYEDKEISLWHVLNTVQENIIQGGVYGKTKTGKNHTTRAVKSINADIKLNKDLWTLAEQYKIA